MTYTRFAIKEYVKTRWVYLPNGVDELNDKSSEFWNEHPRYARQFATYDEAEKYLNKSFDVQNWKGEFEIEKIFISL